MAPPRQFHAGITALSVVHMCLASPRHYQGSFSQVSLRSLSFMRVLQAHGTTKADSRRYHRVLYCSCVSCKPTAPPRQFLTGITAFSIVHACLASCGLAQAGLMQGSPRSLSFMRAFASCAFAPRQSHTGVALLALESVCVIQGRGTGQSEPCRCDCHKGVLRVCVLQAQSTIRVPVYSLDLPLSHVCAVLIRFCIFRANYFG